MTKVKSNDIVKPAKSTKPRSKLQQVQAQANWAVYFKLQPFNTCYVSKLVLSEETKDLIAQYNDITRHLKESISIDASMTKMLIRERDAKIKAEAKEIAEAQRRAIEDEFLPF
tara:strand:- start:316 stop:654 length:339 start_codon:yes stop_codon:yes gene_type:complete